MGFVDYLRMGMGWWSSPERVDGSIILDEVLCDPAILMDDAVVPTLIMDDWSTDSAGIELSSVEMV